MGGAPLEPCAPLQCGLAALRAYGVSVTLRHFISCLLVFASSSLGPTVFLSRCTPVFWEHVLLFLPEKRSVRSIFLKFPMSESTFILLSHLFDFLAKYRIAHGNHFPLEFTVYVCVCVCVFLASSIVVEKYKTVLIPNLINGILVFFALKACRVFLLPSVCRNIVPWYGPACWVFSELFQFGNSCF